MIATMKRLAGCAVLLVSTLGLSQAAVAAAHNDALAIVQSYMNALLIGDTGSMNSHLGTQMLAERGAMLANPNYGRTLQRAYRGASYEIVESDQKTAEQASVLVKIVLANSEQVHVRFVLGDTGTGYAILSES